MGIRFLQTYHFRNIKDGIVEFDSDIVIFRGPNGQGKTNCLEALYFLCYGSSFRKKMESKIVTFGEENGSIIGEMDNDGEVTKVQIILGKKGKEIKRNDKILRDRKELINSMPCILFNHEDIFFVKGSQEDKRWFFNQTACLYNSHFVDTLRDYSKILKSRNLCLREYKKKDMLEILTYQLIEKGLEINNLREKMIQEWDVVFTEVINKVEGLPEELKITYRPSWKSKSFDDLVNFYKNQEDKERNMGTSLYGPHRDRFFFVHNHQDYVSTASTGQIRLLSLILRMTQGIFYCRHTGKKPILLMDDVLLELDGKRRVKFLENLPAFEQLFLTFLPEEKDYFVGKSKKEFFLTNGELIEK